MSDFEVRALEIHSNYAWDFEWIMKSIEFMKENDMNTLVLHRNDLIDLIVYPGKYFGCEKESYHNIFERYREIFRKLYKYTPTRRSGPYQRRAFLKRVVEEAKRAGIKVYIENKELYFPEVLLEFFPHLQKNGAICPTEPFWMSFVSTKYKEFFEEFPEIAGIITAPATGESKVSISSNRCKCELCQSTTQEQWYNNLIMAMYEPIKEAGKQLIIRDFVFNAEDHQRISEVMEKMPSDIAISLKNTPHDYYPTFPDNPRIGNVGDHDQWIEFDAWGQYFGWGISPAILIEDFRRRMKYAKERKAKGVIFRTDWESLDGHSVYHTPNMINLYAGAALSQDLSADSVGIYVKWLEHVGFYKEGLTNDQQRATALWLQNIMNQTWEVTSRTAFVDGCVFSDSSQLPISMDHALWLAEEKNSLKEWDASKSDVFSGQLERVKFNLQEKDEALRLVNSLKEQILQGNDGLSKEGFKDLSDRFEIFAKYVEAFRAAAQSIILTHYRLTQDPSSEFYTQSSQQLDDSLEQLLELSRQFESLFNTTSFQHRVYTLLDPERLTVLYNDLTERLANNKRS